MSPETCAPSERFPVTSCRTTCCCHTWLYTKQWWYQNTALLSSAPQTDLTMSHIFGFILLQCALVMSALDLKLVLSVNLCVVAWLWCCHAEPFIGLLLQVSANLKLQEKVESRREMVSDWQWPTPIRCHMKMPHCSFHIFWPVPVFHFKISILYFSTYGCIQRLHQSKVYNIWFHLSVALFIAPPTKNQTKGLEVIITPKVI